MATTVLLIDDHTIVRQGVRALLEASGFEVVGDAANGHEGLRLAERLHPDVALVDLAMPTLNGIDTCREMRRASAQTRTVMLTMYREDRYILEALRAGIRGCVLKTQMASDLAQAIHEVMHGGIYLSPGVSRVVVDAYLARAELPPDPLSPRERQVLQLVAEGKTTKEIAVFRGISVKTAESHRVRLMGRLDIHDTAGLVRYAIREGVIQP
jgi:DNA-binding NarL/FixJ family response regulator